MDGMVIRMLRPAAVALVMFGAIFGLTHDPYIAMVCMSVPLLLGWLGVMDNVAYGLTAVALMVAVGTALLPDWVKSRGHAIYDQVSERMVNGEKPRAAESAADRHDLTTQLTDAEHAPVTH